MSQDEESNNYQFIINSDKELQRDSSVYLGDKVEKENPFQIVRV
jgi:hypothetical protein